MDRRIELPSPDIHRDSRHEGRGDRPACRHRDTRGGQRQTSKGAPPPPHDIGQTMVCRKALGRSITIKKMQVKAYVVLFWHYVN